MASVKKRSAALILACLCVAYILCNSPVNAENYVVQTRVLVDYAAWEKFVQINYGATHEDLENNIKEMFIEIADLYKKVNGTDLTFQFEITDYQMVPYYDEVLEPSQSRKVSFDMVVPNLAGWLEKNKKSDYDIAVLFTGYDISDAFGTTFVGYSNVGHVCQADGVAAIEFTGKPLDVPVTAHEIGHILGISHDGTADYQGGDATDCDAQSGYLMNSGLLVNLGKFIHFSACSAKLLRERLDKLNKAKNNCLKDGPRASVVSGPRPGAKMTPDDVCRKQFGVYSRFSRKYNKGYGDDMCATLQCTPGNDQRKIVPTPAGLKCGKNKQCIKGKCVVTPDGDPLMSDTCPYGERTRLEKETNLFCAKMPKEGKCSIHKSECCYSCGSNKNPVLNMTADHACSLTFGKDAVLNRDSYTTYGKDFCRNLHCLTGMENGKPVIETRKAPDGLPCGGTKRCNNGWCVSPYTNRPNIPTTCPYGDQPWVGTVTSTCQDAIAAGNGCQGLERTCCKSCAGT